jgi:hypothetical protein
MDFKEYNREEVLSELAYARPSKIIDLESDVPQAAGTQHRATPIILLDSPPWPSNSRKRARTPESSNRSSMNIKTEPSTLARDAGMIKRLRAASTTSTTSLSGSAQYEQRSIKLEPIDVDAMDDPEMDHKPASTIKENSVKINDASLRKVKFEEEVEEITDMSRIPNLHDADTPEPEERDDDMVDTEQMEEKAETNVGAEVSDLFSRLEKSGLIGDY